MLGWVDRHPLVRRPMTASVASYSQAVRNARSDEQETPPGAAQNIDRDVELALHVPVIGDSVAPFMAGPDTDAAAVRAADSLAFLPCDPSAAAEEIQRRREQLGFSYFVFGADVAGALAPVVAELAGR